MVKIEDFKQTTKKDIDDLNKFKGEALTRLGKFEKFDEKEFTPWKTETDKRLVDLEKKHGDCIAWKSKVSGLLDGLEKNKLSISDYKAEKDKIDTRLGSLEDFKGQMTTIFTRDQSKNESRLEDLEKRVKSLEDKTTATDTKINNSLQVVTVRIGEAEQKSEECCNSVKSAIKELGEKFEDIRRNPPQKTRATTKTINVADIDERITTTGPSGQLNYRSPDGIIVRVNNGRDILVNGSGEASQSHSVTRYPATQPSPGGPLINNSSNNSLEDPPPSYITSNNPGALPSPNTVNNPGGLLFPNPSNNPAVVLFSNTINSPGGLLLNNTINSGSPIVLPTSSLLALPTVYPPHTTPPITTPSPTLTPAPTTSNTTSNYHYHPRSSHRRSRYYRENEEVDGQYNMQQMPAIHLGFSRTTPGGLFSKGKTDCYDFCLGGGRGVMESGRGKRGVKHLESR
jgi:hypothetical protein